MKRTRCCFEVVRLVAAEVLIFAQEFTLDATEELFKEGTRLLEIDFLGGYEAERDLVHVAVDHLESFVQVELLRLVELKLCSLSLYIRLVVLSFLVDTLENDLVLRVHNTCIRNRHFDFSQSH